MNFETNILTKLTTIAKNTMKVKTKLFHPISSVFRINYGNSYSTNIEQARGSIS